MTAKTPTACLACAVCAGTGKQRRGKAEFTCSWCNGSGQADPPYIEGAATNA